MMPKKINNRPNAAIGLIGCLASRLRISPGEYVKTINERAVLNSTIRCRALLKRCTTHRDVRLKPDATDGWAETKTEYPRPCSRATDGVAATKTECRSCPRHDG